MPLPPLPSRRLTAAMLGIVAFGLILRLWGIGNGLPYVVGVDEPEIMERAMHMMKTGDFNPHPFFDYPAFMMYVQTAVASVRFLAGAQASKWSALDQVWS